MNSVTLVLAIIIIVLVYILYVYMTSVVSPLQKAASLNTAVPGITKFEGPSNTRYGYSIWVYVNSWSNNSAKTIFSRKSGTKEYIKLYLDSVSPTLKVNLALNNSDSDTMIVTKNFPLQKWVSIAVSVDNQFMDVYLDGKLVKSQRFYKQVGWRSKFPETPPNSTTAPIYLGNNPFTPFDAYISEFKRWTVPIDPDSAWKNYLDGNGTSALSKAFSSYGVDVSILKNNVEQASFSF
jgi:hypothetical protein